MEAACDVIGVHGCVASGEIWWGPDDGLVSKGAGQVGFGVGDFLRMA